MRQWHDWIRAALAGAARPARTGTGTRSVFGLRTEWDLQEGFPAVTTKNLAFGQVKAELAAFLRGASSLEEFHAQGCTIWDGNINNWKTPLYEGDAGRIYGVQWRGWRSAHIEPGPMRLTRGGSGTDVVVAHETDQLRALVDGLRKDPFGRRHLVTAWNPGELSDMCLPPCHYAFQCYAQPLEERHGVYTAFGKMRLSLMVHLRSLDLFLGMPFDVASYALLTHLIAKELGWQVGRLVMTAGDAHVYLNHAEQVATVLGREPCDLPRLWLDPRASLFNLNPEHALLENYHSLGPVAAPLNV